MLGVSKNATGDKIRQAFRKLAFKYHPDHNGNDGATEQFKEINEAYEVLSDPEKRATYDRYGHGAADGVFGQGFEGFNFGGFGDIFDAFFSGAGTAGRQAPQRGADLQARVTITLEEAAFGVDKEIEISRTENCSVCHGNGSQPGSEPSRCPECNGSGQVRQEKQSIFGRFTNITTCSRCRGEGRIITDPCPQCRGSGKEKFRRTLHVKIPAGIEDGSRIRLSGDGDAGSRNGPPGDLYLHLSVLEHELFRRDGDNILYQLPVNFAQAALGTDVEVPTLDGNVKLKVPAGSQTGQVFRLKDKGISHLHGRGRGSQLVELRVVTPESLNKKQRQLLEELAKTLNPGGGTGKR